MSRKKKVTSGAVVVLFVIFGFALAGGTPEPILPHCSDGIDNDGDGVIDSDDMDCRRVTGISSGPGEPAPSVYCPAWDDENNPPTTPEQCGN